MAVLFLSVLLLGTGTVPAAGARPRGPEGPLMVSPEITADHHDTFRIPAPNAGAARLIGGDIPGNGQGAEMTQYEEGLWEVTLGPLPSGACRCHFNVDGAVMVDPRNPAINQSNHMSGVWLGFPGRSFRNPGMSLMARPAAIIPGLPRAARDSFSLTWSRINRPCR